MTKIIRFRVVLDYENDVFRDIEIDEKSNFAQLHDMVQEAFGFDNSQMASFYVSDEEWEKGQEIALFDMNEPSHNESDQPILPMKDTPIGSIITEKGQKLLYVFDFMLMWCFFIDVVSVSKAKENMILPRIVQRFGEAPDQYSKSPEFDMDIEEMDPDEHMRLSLEDEIDDMFDDFDSGDENRPDFEES